VKERMMSSGPAVMKTSELADVLQDIIEGICREDCFGGWIEFHYWDEEAGAGRDEYSVMGAYRVGNLEGQGGMRIIGGDTSQNPVIEKLAEENQQLRGVLGEFLNEQLPEWMAGKIRAALAFNSGEDK
jgi:hypothetical protein